MNAVVMDNAVIGEESLVAATAFVKSGFQCSPRSLVIGSPAMVRRTLSDKEVAWKSAATREYQALARRSSASLREVLPQSKIEGNRPRFDASTLKPKAEIDSMDLDRE